MKTRRTTIILFLIGILFAAPVQQATANTCGGIDAKVKRIRIRVERTGGYKITTKISGGTEGSTVKVEMVPSSKESPKPTVGTFSLKVTSKEENGDYNAEKSFACVKDDCLFGRDAAEAGDKYNITTTVLDKNGIAISKTTTKEVTVEDAPIDIQVKFTRLRLRRLGRKGRPYYHIVAGKITGNPDSTIIKVNIAPSSKESPTPTIDSFTTKITSIDDKGNFTAIKYFTCENKDCLFEKDFAEEGDKYNISVEAFNLNGEPISKTKTSEVTVDIDDSECEGNYSMKSISFTGLDYYSPSSEANSSDYPLFIKSEGSTSQTISIPLSRYRKGQYHKVGNLCVLSGMVRISGRSKSGSTVTTINAIFNEKTQALEANWQEGDTFVMTNLEVTSVLSTKTINAGAVKSSNLRIISVEGNTITFKLRKVKETTCDDKDSTCSAPVVLSEGITLKSSIRGSFQVIEVDGIKISQKDKALTDLDVEAVVEMKNCKGISIYVAIPLKYNEKTGTYMNSKALALCNKTGMEVVSMNINAKKERDDGWRGQFVNVDVDISLSST